MLISLKNIHNLLYLILKFIINDIKFLRKTIMIDAVKNNSFYESIIKLTNLANLY